MTDISPSQPEDNADFVQELGQTEQMLVQLKQRYQQVKQAQQQQTELQGEGIQLGEEWENHQLPELEQELQRINRQIQELSLILESELLSNDELMRIYKSELRSGLLGEIFWQVARFGGLGILIGWLLKTWAMRL
ncbi:MAG: DUF2203 domain-containing protein [Microcystaceae cyanobacterium]